MEIDDLIVQGYEVKSKCFKTSEYSGEYIYGEEYEKWIQLSIRYLEKNFPDSNSTKEFILAGKNANGFKEKFFHKMIGILESFRDIPEVRFNDKGIDRLLESICINFNKCAKALLNRRKDKGVSRETIKINDEYDMQELLNAVLKLFVEDIRLEDYVPSYAGGNSRIDFYLPKYDMYIETKITSKSLKDRDLGEQLAIDFVRYQGNPKCKKVIFLIYDKDGYLSNPYGLISDLEKQSTDELEIKVYISPL